MRVLGAPFTPHIHASQKAENMAEKVFEGGVGPWDHGTFFHLRFITPHLLYSNGTPFTPHIHASQKAEKVFEGGVGPWDHGTF